MSYSRDALLTILSDGNYHSGVDIGRRMGMSRSAIWKQLQKLIDLGVDIESVKGKGYRLPGGFEALDKEVICSYLSPYALEHIPTFELCQHVESTNTSALQKISDVATASAISMKGYVCIAEHQTAGKGRRGRTWVSPFGSNLYLSLMWEFDGGANQLEGLSLAVGIAVAKSLREIGLSDVRLKWPNDVLVKGKKLGGILVEMAGDPSGQCQVVIGIGLNVHMRQNGSIDQPWTSVVQYVPQISKNRLAAELINQLLGMLIVYEAEGFAAFYPEWSQWDGFFGLDVQLHSGETVTSGVANGIYPNGALRLTVGHTDHAIYGGEVSVRQASNDS